MLENYLENYFKKEAIRRLNNKNLISDDTEEDIKETLTIIRNTLSLMSIKSYDYDVELKKMANMSDGSIEVHYIITLS